jgi:hypothetical protein
MEAKKEAGLRVEPFKPILRLHTQLPMFFLDFSGGRLATDIFGSANHIKTD